ncbi:MAG: TIGR03986 family CRISPR-associated RAMP protein [Acidobacteria bacterium]|nr:TIGR03986 family CRISPR-associated RAMP protein [Acidobacteriota bacterium]MBI3427567.1 TIGR03986 family CRISPR-associated RAMP protein [Acidobacteriota bacterium]
MTHYHNPYHFVPVVDEARPDDLSVADFEDLKVNQVRHDKYVDRTFSGRIICRLTTESPIFIGANRKEASEQTPADVSPFLLDQKPAIPASSLRGLISSLAEAASNSAMRVLADTAYSYRKWSQGRIRKIELDSLFKFFAEIDPEVLPFDSYSEQISIAEQLFGFVEDQKTGSEESAIALGSRIYFSHGKTNAGDDCLLSPVILRILDSPKPPSPALYFKRKAGNNRHISKGELNSQIHIPQGRKFYLHHRPQDINAKAWETRNSERNQQKTKITPIKAQTEFYFHVDFDNLSTREFGLLLYTLKPTPEFRHKLGMGKSLGLGAVNIEPVGFFRINRHARYSPAGLFAPRYSECWLAANAQQQDWPDMYAGERTVTATPLAIEPLRQAFRTSMNQDIRQALELIGNPASIRHRVVTPLVSVNGREADAEQETFLWFVANDRQHGQRECLQPLNAQSSEMPALRSLPKA